MNIVEAVKSVLKQYVGFSGRARRSEFWFWVLAIILGVLIIAIIETILGLSHGGDSGPIMGLFILIILLPGLAVTFRRLHDIGRSGWWVGGYYLAWIAYFIFLTSLAASVSVVAVADTSTIAAIGIFGMVFLIGAMLYLIPLLVFFCMDSQKGPNKYGPNPKNEGNYDIFE